MELFGLQTEKLIDKKKNPVNRLRLVIWIFLKKIYLLQQEERKKNQQFCRKEHFQQNTNATNPLTSLQKDHSAGFYETEMGCTYTDYWL